MVAKMCIITRKRIIWILLFAAVLFLIPVVVLELLGLQNGILVSVLKNDIPAGVSVSSSVCLPRSQVDWCVNRIENPSTKVDPSVVRKSFHDRVDDMISKCRQKRKSVKYESEQCSVKFNKNIRKESSKYDTIVVGADLGGLLVAYIHAHLLGRRVIVLDPREVVGLTSEDVEDVGFFSKIGISSLRTSSDLFVTYVKNVDEMVTQNRESSLRSSNYQFQSFPLSISSVNSYFGDTMIHGDKDMEKFLISSKRAELDIVLESLIQKIWGVSMNDISEDLVKKKFGYRDNWDHRYYNGVKEVEMVARYGTGQLIDKLMSHEKIDVFLNVENSMLKTVKDYARRAKKSTFVSSSSLDWYFEFIYGPFERRFFDFVKIEVPNLMYFQPHSIVDYPLRNTKVLRVVEPKHVLGSLFDGIDEGSSVLYVQYMDEECEDEQQQLCGSVVSMSKENSRIAEKYGREVLRGELVNIIPGPLYVDSSPTTSSLDSAMEIVFKEKNLFEKIKKEVEEVSVVDAGVTKPKMSVVICFCKKMFPWIPSFYDMYRKRFYITFYVYSKCGQTKAGMEFFSKHPELPVVIEEIPNVGREGQLYLHFMLFNDTRIGDVNFFLQDHLHSAECIEKLEPKLFDLAESIRIDNEEIFERDLRLDGNHFMAFNGLYSFFFTQFPKNKKEWNAGLHDFPGAADFNFFFSQDFVPPGRRNNFPDWNNLHDFFYVCCGEFVSSGPLIRQVKSRYSGLLLQIYEALGKESNPIRGISLEHGWVALFTGHSLSIEIHRKDQIESVCGCYKPDTHKDFFPNLKRLNSLNECLNSSVFV